MFTQPKLQIYIAKKPNFAPCMPVKPPVIKTLLPDAGKTSAHPSADLSVTYTSVKLPFAEIEGLINHYLPAGYPIFQTSTLQLGIAQSLLPYSVAVNITKPANLRLSTQNEALYLHLPLHAAITLKDKGLLLSLTPLEAVMQVEVTARVHLHLKADWQLFTRTEIEAFNWHQSPQLRVLGIPVAALTIIERELERFIAPWMGKIDQLIAEKVPFISIAQMVWKTLQEPFHIWEQPNMWLRCFPQKVYVSGIKTEAQHLHITLYINGGVVNTTQQLTNEDNRILPLPDAQPLLNPENAQKHSAIKVVNFLSYNKISELINQHLQQFTYHFFNSRYYLRFGRFKLYAQPEKNLVFAEAVFTGSMRGRAFLHFNPHYSITHKTLLLQNFEFELQTSSLLLNLANRFAKQTLADRLCDTIQELINRQLAELNSFLHDFLRRQQVENVVFTTNLEAVFIESVTFAHQHIKAVLALNGNTEAVILLNGYF